MNIRSTLVAFFKYCRKRKACSFRPEELEIPRGAVCKERAILQPKDLVTLFTVDTTCLYGKVVQDDFINYYRFAVVTGLRPGELLGIMAGDLSDSTLRIKRSINFYGEITPGKNKNASRAQELTPIAKAIWDKQLSESDGLYVFGCTTEKRLLQRWHKYCAANGLTKTTLYELRHTFVSAVQSLPEAYIKSLVGHSESMDTGAYTHHMDDTQKKIAEAVQKIFSSILSPAQHVV